MTVIPGQFDSTGAKAVIRPERIGPLYADLIGDSSAVNAGNTNPSVQQFMDARRGFKKFVRVATAAALPSCVYANGTSGVGATLTAYANGALTIDGISISAGDRILVKNQASAAQNGIYVATNAGTSSAKFVLTRATDANSSTELITGTQVLVNEGTANSGSIFYLSNSSAVTLGTTGLVFKQVSNIGQTLVNSLVAGAGIALSGATGNVTITANATKTVVSLTSLSSDYNAAANTVLFVGLTAAATGNIVLPSAATAGPGAEIVIKDTKINFATYPITVSVTSLDKVENGNSYVLDNSGFSSTFISDGVENWWTI